MKKHLILSACLIMAISSFAQKKDFSYKFYGQIRTDLYYNSRANEETVDGLFYMYPKDEVFDSNGRDLNATANGSFYTLYTRLGLDVKGPKLDAPDFRQSGSRLPRFRYFLLYYTLASRLPEPGLGTFGSFARTNLASALR